MSRQALLALWACGLASLALSTPAISMSKMASSKSGALRSATVEWVRYMARGNAARACELQVEEEVNGVPCAQLPPAFTPPPSCPEGGAEARYLSPREQILKVKRDGPKGSALLRSSRSSISFQATLRLRRIDGTWRISALEWTGHRLIPAGLANEGPRRVRNRLWPVC
jgi:hypothetical protein